MALRSSPLLALALAACAVRSSGTRPDDMSRAGHEEEAEAHELAAIEHEGRFDPAATRQAAVPSYGYDERGFGQPGPPASAGGGAPYNPTEAHVEHAREHRAHAEQHRAAASHLADFEDAACAGVAPDARAQCPIIAFVVDTEPVALGARLVLGPGADPDAALALARCHMAFARAGGWTGESGCPFYVRGARVELSERRDALLVTAEDGPATAEIRRRAQGAGPSER